MQSANKAFKRAFTAPLNEVRCNGTVIMRDGSGARCMHKKMADSEFCRQHAKIERRKKLLPTFLSGD